MWCVIFLPNIGTVEPWNLLPGYKAGLWSYVLCLVWYVIKLCFAMCGYVRYVVLCCVMLHLSCCGMFCCVTLRSVTFRYVVVCCVMLCRVMSCHATLCHVMLCNVMLWYGRMHLCYRIISCRTDRFQRPFKTANQAEAFVAEWTYRGLYLPFWAGGGVFSSWNRPFKSMEELQHRFPKSQSI